MHSTFKHAIFVFLPLSIGFFKFLDKFYAVAHTVKLLLSDHLRDNQKAVAEEKGSPNAIKVHHTKQRDSIYYTLTTHYFQQNPMLLVPI